MKVLNPNLWSFAVVAVIAICVTRSITAQDVPELTEAEFQEGLKLVASPKDKPWRQIPWKISLLDAQNEAAKSKKPIFIWAMDGHPLGCT